MVTLLMCHKRLEQHAWVWAPNELVLLICELAVAHATGVPGPTDADPF